MKKIYASILILSILLLAGCSIKTSVVKNDDYVEPEASELQQDLENVIKNDNKENVEDKLNNFNASLNEAMNNPEVEITE